MKENISLRPLEKQDVEKFYTWINDKEVIEYSLSLFQKLNKKEDIDKWFQGVLTPKEEVFNIGIVNSENNELIGYAGISSISKTNNSGEFFIFIGEKNMWNKGIGTFVTKEVAKIGFEELNLNRIMLTVSDLNKGAVKAYEKANFKQEGMMREACFRNGKYHNKIIMSILKSEF